MDVEKFYKKYKKINFKTLTNSELKQMGKEFDCFMKKKTKEDCELYKNGKFDYKKYKKINFKTLTISELKQMGKEFDCFMTKKTKEDYALYKNGKLKLSISRDGEERLHRLTEFIRKRMGKFDYGKIKRY